MNEDGAQPRNPLLQKFGPLPVWAWLLLITGVLLAYWLYERNKAGATVTAATTGIPSSTDSTTQSTTPTPETGLTAAQETELATLEAQEPGIADVIKDDTAQDAAGKKKKPKRPVKPKPKPKVPATHGATAHPSGVKQAA